MKSFLDAMMSSLDSALMGKYAKVLQTKLHADALSLLSRDRSNIRCQKGPSDICIGSGVFASHAIRQGEAICLYPGLEIPPLPHLAACSITMTGPSAHRSHSESSSYCISLCGGGSLDASVSSLKDLAGIENPSAIGHLINHSNAANCESRSFQWSQCISGAELSEGRLDRYAVPNRIVEGFFFKSSNGDEVRLPPFVSERDSITKGLSGLAFIATRDLVEGEEVLLNYRLNGPPYPLWARDWYVGNE